MNRLISVIIPIYNTKAYLVDAIDSLLVQKNFIKEIILINDGSTDGTKELIDKEYKDNPLFIIVHSENNGQGVARNIGIEKASGEYIYFFDSDDILLPGLFENFIETYNSYPDIELFCFSGESFLDNNYPLEEVDNPNILSKKAYKRKIEKFCKNGEEAFIILSNEKSFFPGPPLYIFKKSVLIEKNIMFIPTRYEDEEFTPKLFLSAGPTYISNKVFFRRRIRRGSTMQKQRNFDDIWGYIKTIETLIKLLISKKIKPQTKKLLNKRIENFVKTIIIIKTAYKISLTKEQKSIIKKFLEPIFKKNKELLIFSYKFPIEYRLRKYKSKILR